MKLFDAKQNKNHLSSEEMFQIHFESFYTLQDDLPKPRKKMLVPDTKFSAK